MQPFRARNPLAVYTAAMGHEEVQRSSIAIRAWNRKCAFPPCMTICNECSGAPQAVRWTAPPPSALPYFVAHRHHAWKSRITLPKNILEICGKFQRPLFCIIYMCLLTAKKVFMSIRLLVAWLCAHYADCREPCCGKSEIFFKFFAEKFGMLKKVRTFATEINQRLQNLTP